MVTLSRRQSYLANKLLSLFFFVCLKFIRFSIYRHFFFFLNLALNLSPFCLLLCSFTALHHVSQLKSCCWPNIANQRVQQIRLDTKSFLNGYQFIRYLSVAFKNGSVKKLIYPCCLSKCFVRNKLDCDHHYHY